MSATQQSAAQAIVTAVHPPADRSQPFHHPVAGDLILNFNAPELPADPGQTMIVYTAEPGSPSQQALRLCAALEHAGARHAEVGQAEAQGGDLS